MNRPGDPAVTREMALARWDPEDTAAWAAGNHRIARRNLVAGMIADHVAFSVWAIWSVLVLFMPTSVYGLTVADKLMLGALAALTGALVRIPYTLGIARFGGRRWTAFSAVVLVIPTAMTIALLANPGLPLWPYLVCAALTGLGGGNYSASVVNVNAFYPQRCKGWALAVSAGVGSLGVAAVQIGGLALLAVGAPDPTRVWAGYLVVLTVVGMVAPLFMDDLRHPLRARHFRWVLTDGDTWVIVGLYACAFGSFLGFAFGFSRVLYENLHTPDRPAMQTALSVAQIAFVGPLLGSLARIYAGRLADRVGGQRVTLAAFAGMVLAAAALAALGVRDARDAGAADTVTLVGYAAGFLVLFALAGAASGALFQLTTALFVARSAVVPAVAALDVAQRRQWSRTMAGAAIGLAGAFGGFGAVAVNLVLRHSYQHTGQEALAFTVFLPGYLLALAVAWWRYGHRGAHPGSRSASRWRGSVNRPTATGWRARISALMSATTPGTLTFIPASTRSRSSSQNAMNSRSATAPRNTTRRQSGA